MLNLARNVHDVSELNDVDEFIIDDDLQREASCKRFIREYVSLSSMCILVMCSFKSLVCQYHLGLIDFCLLSSLIIRVSCNFVIDIYIYSSLFC